MVKKFVNWWLDPLSKIFLMIFRKTFVYHFIKELKQKFCWVEKSVSSIRWWPKGTFWKVLTCKMKMIYDLFSKMLILISIVLDGSHSFDKLGRSRSQSMSRTSSGSGESPFYEDYAEIVDDPESADYSSPSRDFELNR